MFAAKHSQSMGNYQLSMVNYELGRGPNRCGCHSCCLIAIPASYTVIPAPYTVIPAKAGIHPCPAATPGITGVLDSVLSLPKGAGMTDRAGGVMVIRAGMVMRGVDSRFRGNDG